MRPYLQLRGGVARLHPRSELFAFEPPPEEPGDSPTHPANGFHVGLLPGLEIRLNRSLALDLSGHFDYFSVSEYDLSPVGLPPASSGTTFEARVGVRWHPDDDWPGLAREPPARARRLGSREEPRLGGGGSPRHQLGGLGVERVHPQPELHPDQPPELVGQLRRGLHLRRQPVQDEPVHPSLERRRVLQLRPGQRHRLLGLRAVRAGRGLLLGMLRRDAPDVLQRHDLDRHRRDRGGRADVPAVLPAPGQPGHGQEPDLPRDRRLRDRSRARIQPRGVGPLHRRPAEPGGAPRLAAPARALLRVRGRADHRRGRVDQREHEHLRLHRRQPHLRKRLRQQPPEAVRLHRRRLPVQLRRQGEAHAAPHPGGPLLDGPWAGSAPTAPKYAFAVVQHFDYHNNQAYEFGQQAFGPSFFARYRLSDKIGLGLRWDGMVSILGRGQRGLRLPGRRGEPGALPRVRLRAGPRHRPRGRARSGAEPAARPLLPPAMDQREQRLHLQQARRGAGGSEGSGREPLPAGPGRPRLRSGLQAARRGRATRLVVLRKSYYDAAFLEDKDQRNPEARVYLAWDFGR